MIEAFPGATMTTDDVKQPCGECGALVGQGEYHPYAFCAMVKAGLNPWREVRIIAGQLGIGDPGEKPPLVTRIVVPAGSNHDD